MHEMSMLAIDFTKHSLQVCGIGIDGFIVFKKAVSSPAVVKFCQNKSLVVSMEDSPTSHYLDGAAQSFAHEVRLIPVIHVKLTPPQ